VKMPPLEMARGRPRLQLRRNCFRRPRCSSFRQREFNLQRLGCILIQPTPKASRGTSWTSDSVRSNFHYEDGGNGLQRTERGAKPNVSLLTIWFDPVDYPQQIGTPRSTGGLAGRQARRRHQRTLRSSVTESTGPGTWVSYAQVEVASLSINGLQAMELKIRR